MEKRFETKLGDKSLVVETGLAPQANAALKLTYGETVVLVTAVLGKNTKNGTDYLPLTVEYEEKMYAAGRMKGSRFMKREGRATDEAVLTGRLIDRIVRPGFDQRIRNDIQIVATVLSFDGINDPDIPAIVGASLVLGASSIPWRGPLSAVRVGKIDDKFIINPSYEEREKSLIDLTFASDGEVINMIEFGSNGADNKEITEVW
jgi:polyribonucleotide nucleotidyltransferase